MHMTSDTFPCSWQLFSEFEEIIAIARDLQAHGRQVVAFATAALESLRATCALKEMKEISHG
jgi:hypothetical protein